MTNWDYDKDNASFWNYLCGMNAANFNKFDVTTKDGIDQFDKWYFDFYPYLEEYLNEILADSTRIVEIGIGLGSVSRFLGSRTEKYLGIDIAPSVIDFNKSEYSNRGFQGEFLNKSILSQDFHEYEGLFDAVVAIGSLHHSGDLELAIKNSAKFLKSGGVLLIMVYNKFSIQNFRMRPLKTFYALIQSILNLQNLWPEEDSSIRLINDSNSTGDAAPSTIYASKKFFYGLDFEKSKIEIQNINNIRIARNIVLPRKKLLKNIARLFGTDIYAVIRK